MLCSAHYSGAAEVMYNTTRHGSYFYVFWTAAQNNTLQREDNEICCALIWGFLPPIYYSYQAVKMVCAWQS